MAYVGVDLETEGLDASYNPNKLIYSCAFVPEYHTEHEKIVVDCVSTPSQQVLLEDIKLILESYAYDGYTPVFHNSSFDVSVLECRNIRVPQYDDTMLMSYVWQPGEMQFHSLGHLAPLVGERKMDKPDWKNPVINEKFLSYNVQDSRITVKLARYFENLLKTDARAWHFYQNIELPYSVLVRSMQGGTYLDVERIREFEAREREIIAELDRQVFSIAGHEPGEHVKYKKSFLYTYHDDTPPCFSSCMQRMGKVTGEHCELKLFNPNSDDQVVAKLQKLYGWKPASFNEKSGKPKMDKHIKEHLSNQFPLLKLLTERDKHQTLHDTFLMGLLTRQQNGMVHAQFIQTHTRTGRLSSRDPNLQNIPARTEGGAELRRMFIAPPGYRVVVGDVDRFELRILAAYLEMLTGDSYLADAARAGLDEHTINAEQWGVPRQNAKNGIFTVVYGGGAQKLAGTLGVGLREAQAIIQAIRDTTKIFQLKEMIASYTRQNSGIFHDWMGRRLYVPEILSNDNEVRAAGTRRVGNYFIQGSQGSIFKKLQLEVAFEMGPIDGWLSLSIHDEAVYIIKDKHVDKFIEIANRVFNRNDILTYKNTYVPITAAFHAADNWYDAKAAGG
jgi:DNA polymerase I-like protein with 3'-5' exonuclease and polymerase domains